MTLEQFVKKYLGKQVEYHSFNPNAKYQCVDLANQFIVEVLKLTPVIGTDAKDFPLKIKTSEFEVIKNTPEFIPKVNDIAIWNGRAGGGAGHIAVVRDNKATVNTFNSLDQNWSKPLYVTLETHDYKNVSHFLRPRFITEDLEENTMKTYTQEEWELEREERNKNWTLYQGELEKNKELQKEISRLNDEVGERKREADQFTEDMAKRLDLPATADRSMILSRMSELLNEEEAKRQLEKKLDEEQRKHDQEVNKLLDDVAQLRAELEEQKKRNETLMNRLDKLEQQAVSVQEKKEEIGFLEYITSLLKRK